MPYKTDQKRSFPNYSWAWPRGSVEELIRAAAWTDGAKAAALFQSWMKNHDIDAVTHAEHRLLVSVASRFPEQQVPVDHRPRLMGLQRMLWSKSRFSLKAAEPALKKLRNAGIDVLVFKGAARSAMNMADLKGRIAHDVDILVRQGDFKTALRLLMDDNWRASNGRSAAYCQAAAAAIRGINLFRGEFGDIDLHQRLLHQYTVLDDSEEDLWGRAQSVSFLGCDVYVASPTDQLIIAIAHGGLDGHSHSDWMVDCAHLVEDNDIDWDLFVSTCKRLDIMAHAAIVLSFMVSRLDADIPHRVLDLVVTSGRRPILSLCSALFQAHPKHEHNLFGLGGRTLAKQARLYKARRQMRRATDLQTIVLRPLRRTKELKDAPPRMVLHDLDVPAGAGSMSIVVEFEACPVKRRFMLELNEGSIHLASLTYRHSGAKGPVTLHANLDIPDREDGKGFSATMESRPSQHLKHPGDADEVLRYNAMPFAILDVTFTPA